MSDTISITFQHLRLNVNPTEFVTTFNHKTDVTAGTYTLNLQGDAGNAGDRTTLEQLGELVTGKVSMDRDHLDHVPAQDRQVLLSHRFHRQEPSGPRWPIRS